jgi:molybdopterin-guanine dinucleotide biosynthesis protein A
VSGFDVVVPAGGAGRRLGGVDKAAVVVDGASLLDRVLTATAAARRTVVVGAPRPTVRPVEWTREEPPGGGPVAGLAAGLDVLAGDRPVVVLATDLPRLTGADVQRLVDALGRSGRAAVDGVAFRDAHGRRQPLAAAYRPGPLRAALAALGPVSGRSMRELLAGLVLDEIPDRGAATDVDTPEDLDRVRTMAGMSEQTLPDWVATVCLAMDVDPALVDVTAVLDLARDAAHGIARPAAPLTTFLAGYVLGVRSHQEPVVDQDEVFRVIEQVRALIPPGDARETHPRE